MSSALLWMIAALVAVGVEIVTVDLTFGLIAVGAGSAAVAAALGAPLWLQGVIGVGVALAGIAFAISVAIALPLGITYATLRTYFERARDSAGLPHVRFHDLRHTYASWLVQSGIGLTAVRDLLGHANLAVTSRYAHLATGHLREAARAAGAKMATGQKRGKAAGKAA